MVRASGKRVALVKLSLTKRSIDTLEPKDRAWIAWDDRLTGFGVRVYPSGRKSFIVNYRAGDGGRKAPNKRIVIGRCDRVSAEQARRMAQQVLGKVAGGDDPAGERWEARGMPTVAEAFDEFLAANPNRAAITEKSYRYLFKRYLGDWLNRPLNSIARKDVEARFNRLMTDHGWGIANRSISLLRSVYRRPCVDIEGLRDPVGLWLAAGGRFHRQRRRKISTPAEVLPRWRAGIQVAVTSPMVRDAFWVGFYTGMRLGEVVSLRWQGVDRAGSLFRIDNTKTGGPLELPITQQLGDILQRRAGENDGSVEGWVFPSPSSSTGHLYHLANHYKAIGEAGGAKFWYHGLRNAFITVAERDLMLPHALVKRLVNHAPPNDVTEGYAADWTIEQLRKPAQRIADTIETLMVAPTGSQAVEA